MFVPSTVNLLICSGLFLVSVFIYWSLLPSRSNVDPMSSSHNHDHGHNMDASKESAVGDDGMQMWFYNSIRVTLWFEQWTTATLPQYILVLAGLAALAVAHEALACMRSHRVSQACKAHEDGGSAAARIHAKVCLKEKLLLASLYFLNIMSSYLLMLAVMTYNVGCFLAVGIGLSLGYLLFFDKQANPAALIRSDNCHVRLLDGE